MLKFDTFNQQVASQMLDFATAAGGLSTYLGFRHVEFTAGRLVAEMDARDDLLTPFGNLHGGCLSALVDHCLGVVFYPLIPERAWVATTEFKLNLLKPVSSGNIGVQIRVGSADRIVGRRLSGQEVIDGGYYELAIEGWSSNRNR